MEKIMRIGLVRHFEVECSHKWLMSAEDFREWAERYDCSPVKMRDLLIEPDIWKTCYCSDLPRAIETANCIYKDGIIMKTPLIREVPMAPIMECSIKLPYLFWLIAGRIAWRYSHQSQPETITQTKERVKKFLASIMEDDNVLIVAHGFLMVQIQEQLIASGFTGDSFTRAQHGRVYMFENN